MTSSEVSTSHSAVLVGTVGFFFRALPMANAPAINETYIRKHPVKYQTAATNLLDVVARSGAEDICRDFLEKIRWPDGAVVCPRCASDSISAITTRHQF